MKKMTISISDELKEKIDKYNADTLIPKSSIITLALDQYFQAKELMSNMKDLAPLMKEIQSLATKIDEKNSQ